MDGPPTPLHRKIAEANRRYYASTAATYDRTETCVTDPRAQEVLRADMAGIVTLLRHRPGGVRALDACAGSGNLTRRLLDAGMHVVAVDISPELLAILRERCAGAAARLSVVEADVADFLAAADGRPFDLITFSSALHHLEDVEAVLARAAARLAPGGLLYTVFNPAPAAERGRFARALERVDYLAFKVLRQAPELPAAVLRRLRRMARRGSGPGGKAELTLDSDNLGVLAEYHVEAGIDDRRLVAVLREHGLQVVWHRRHASGRHRWIERALHALGDVNAFTLLLRRPDPDAAPA